MYIVTSVMIVNYVSTRFDTNGIPMSDFETSQFDYPVGSLKVPGRDSGEHWVHLKTAEQLARALWECPNFDIRKVFQSGGISEGNSDACEGLVALRDNKDRLLLVGSFMCDEIQWPTTPHGMTATDARMMYAQEIAHLRAHVGDLIPRQGQSQSINPKRY